MLIYLLTADPAKAQMYVTGSDREAEVLIYFLTTDATRAMAEASAIGWQRIAANRWGTPERDDIRMVQHMRNFQLIPGGSYIIPASDVADVDPAVNDQPWRFKELVDSGAAQWLPNPAIGDAATKMLVARIKPPPVPLETFISDQGVTAAADAAANEPPPVKPAQSSGTASGTKR